MPVCVAGTYVPPQAAVSENAHRAPARGWTTWSAEPRSPSGIAACGRQPRPPSTASDGQTELHKVADIT